MSPNFFPSHSFTDFPCSCLDKINKCKGWWPLRHLSSLHKRSTGKKRLVTITSYFTTGALGILHNWLAGYAAKRRCLYPPLSVSALFSSLTKTRHYFVYVYLLSSALPRYTYVYVGNISERNAPISSEFLNSNEVVTAFRNLLWNGNSNWWFSLVTSTPRGISGNWYLRDVLWSIQPTFTLTLTNVYVICLLFTACR